MLFPAPQSWNPKAPSRLPAGLVGKRLSQVIGQQHDTHPYLDGLFRRDNKFYISVRDLSFAQSVNGVFPKDIIKDFTELHLWRDCVIMYKKSMDFAESADWLSPKDTFALSKSLSGHYSQEPLFMGLGHSKSLGAGKGPGYETLVRLGAKIARLQQTPNWKQREKDRYLAIDELGLDRASDVIANVLRQWLCEYTVKILTDLDRTDLIGSYEFPTWNYPERRWMDSQNCKTMVVHGMPWTLIPEDLVRRL